MLIWNLILKAAREAIYIFNDINSFCCGFKRL